MTDKALAALRPPPEHEGMRWHWIDHAAFTSSERVWPEPWFGTQWRGHLQEAISPEFAVLLCWRYVGPCDPAAVVIDPENEAQRQAVADALDRSNGLLFSERITRVLTALKGPPR